MKWSQEEIKKLVYQDIEKKEKLGEQAGGSGHLGFISFQIDEIKPPTQTKKGWLVNYNYTKIIETEFTYYPDNPPHEETHSNSFLLVD